MTPLVLLPGMMCDARLFAPQIADFSVERTLQVSPISQHDTIEALANSVLNNAPPRFALAGLSMGGIVAMEIMRQAPERVTHLALIDTNYKAELSEVSARREPQIANVRAGQLREVMRDEMKPNYLSDGPNQSAILDLCMSMAEALGAEVFERQSRAIQYRADQEETLRKVSIPTLIMCGEDDTLCLPERHRLMHELVDGSKLAIIEDAGHLPTLEQPDAATRALREWLELS